MLPSDIARLVLGYLHDEGLENTSRVFLMESPHLEELRQNPNAAILRPSTKTLIATLEEYEDIKDTEKRRNVPDKVLTGLWKRFDSVVGQIKYKYQPSENSLEAQAKRSKRNLMILRTQQYADTQGQPKSNVIVQPKIQGHLIIPNSPTRNLTVVTTPSKKSQAVVMPISNVAEVSIPYTASQVFVPSVAPGVVAPASTSVNSNASEDQGTKSEGGQSNQQVLSNSGDVHLGSGIGSIVVPRRRIDSGSSMNSDMSSSMELQQLSPTKHGQDRNSKPDNTVFKSPKRKSAAPKKRKQVRAPVDHQKKPDPPPPPPPGATPTEEELEEALKELPQVLETLLSNRELQQKLAGSINKAFPTQSQKQDLGVPASPQDPSVGLSLSIDDILNSQMSEDTVHEIIENTSHDPAFESLFSLFTVDKDQYVEQQKEELERLNKDHDQLPSSVSDSDVAEPMETKDSSKPLRSNQQSQKTPTSVPTMAVYGKSPTDSNVPSNNDNSKMMSTPPSAPPPPPMATVLHISEDNTDVEMESVVLPSLDGSEPQIMSPVSVTAPSPLPATKHPAMKQPANITKAMMHETSKMETMLETSSTKPTQETSTKLLPETSTLKSVPGISTSKPLPDPLPSSSLASCTGCMVPPKKRQIHQNTYIGSSSVLKPPDNKTSSSASEEKHFATKKAVSVALSSSISEPSTLNKSESRESADDASSSQATKSDIFGPPSTSCTIQSINAIIAQAKRDLFNPKDSSTPETEMQSSQEQRTSRSRGRKANAQPRRFSRRKTRPPDRFSPCTESKSQKRVASAEKEPHPERSKTEQLKDVKEIPVHESKTMKPKTRSRSKTPKKVDEVVEQLKSPGKSVSTSLSIQKIKSKSDKYTPSKVDGNPPLANLDIHQPIADDATSFMTALQMSPSGRTQSGDQGSVIYTTSPIRTPAESYQLSLTSKSHKTDNPKADISTSDQSEQGHQSSLPKSPISKEQVQTSEMHNFKTPEKQIRKRRNENGSPKISRSPRRAPAKSPNKGVPHTSYSAEDVSNSSTEDGPVFVPTQVKTPEEYSDSEPNTPQMQIVSNPNTPQAQTLTSLGHSSTPMPLTPQVVAEVVEVETSAEIEPSAVDENSVDSVISVNSKDNVIVISDDSKQGTDGDSRRVSGRTETITIPASVANPFLQAEASSDHEAAEDNVQVGFEVEETDEKAVNAVEETGKKATSTIAEEAATEGDARASENLPKVANNEEIVVSENARNVANSKQDIPKSHRERPATVLIKPSQLPEKPSAMLQSSCHEESMDTSQSEQTIAVDTSKPEHTVAIADSIAKPVEVESESESMELFEREAKIVIKMKFPNKEVGSNQSTSTECQSQIQKQEQEGDKEIVQMEESSQVAKGDVRAVENSAEIPEGDVSQCAKRGEINKPLPQVHRPAVVTVPCVISSGDELEPTAILQAPVLRPRVKTPAKDKESRVSEEVQDSIKPMQALLKVISSTDTSGVTSTLTSSKMPLQLVHSQLNTKPGGSKVKRILPKKVEPSGSVVTQTLSNTPLPGFNSMTSTSRTNTPSGGPKKNVNSHIKETPKKADVAEIITPRQDKHSSSKSSNTRPPLRRFVKTGTPQVKTTTPQSHSNKRGMVMRSLNIGGNVIDTTSTPKVYSMPRGTKGGYVVRTLDCHQPGSNGDQTPKSSLFGRSSISPKKHLAKSVSPKDQVSVLGKPTVSPREHACIIGKAAITSPKDNVFSLHAKASGDRKTESNDDKSKQKTPRKRTPRKQDLSAAAAREFEATVDLAAEVLASCSPRKTPIKQKCRSSGGKSSEINQAAEGQMHLSTSPSARFTSIQTAGCVLRNVMNAPKRNLMAEVQGAAKAMKHKSDISQGHSDEKRRDKGRPRLKGKRKMASDIHQGELIQTRSSESEKDESFTKSDHPVESSNIPQTNGDMHIPPAEERLKDEKPETKTAGAAGESKPKKPIKVKKRKRDHGTSDQPDAKKSKKSKLKGKSFPTNMDVDKFLSQLHYPQ